MKLAITKYFPVVVIVLCLANIFLFGVRGKHAGTSLLPVGKSEKFQPAVTPQQNTSPIALATYWQPIENGVLPERIPNQDVAPAAFFVAAAAPLAPPDNEKISITAPVNETTFRTIGSGSFLTNVTNPTFSALIPAAAPIPGKALSPGKLTWSRDSVVITQAVTTETIKAPISTAIQLRENSTNTISASYKSDDGAYAFPSSAILVTCDTRGPLLQHAEVIEAPATGITLIVTFDADDFDEKTATSSAFDVMRQNKDKIFNETMSIQGAPVIAGNTIRLAFAALPSGQYQLTLKNDVLKDIVGNFAAPSGNAAVPRTWTFSVLADRKYGEHIAFPPYAPPKQQTIPPEGFNPGDFVETRVARLYYFRDAHRVAEIINRNIRSYNQAAVTLAERRAEQSRDDADASTDERREKERAAVRSAEQARNAEQKLAAARETLSEVQGLKNTIVDGTKKKEEKDAKLIGLPPVPAGGANDPYAQERMKLTAESEALRKRIAESDANLARFGGDAAVTALAESVKSMEQSVGSLRQTELIKREESDKSDAKEARARAKQFRDEVTAAETDPDTYVAGDMNSVDPVTQCSISVIGEGLIQIRGPIKGINKIRTMMNQIDSPVGQIKIGIFSVQVNGEKGDKMEKVVGDAEGAIDLSRFLVNHSLELLRKAIQSEAATIANQCEMEGHFQVDRDRRYLYSFFGRDFIDELYAMNSEFLNTENKLLSLHAMDTVSLNRALFIVVLAKNDVRSRIVSRFLESTKTELADAEFDFRRSSELKPHTTQKRFPPWNRTHLPVHNHDHKEAIIYEAVHRNAMQRYHFRNVSGFFDTGFVNPDTMNPMQREFIRLAQIFKAQLVAEMEWKQRVMERGLIEDRANDESLRYELLQQVHKRALELERDAYQNLVDAAQKNLSSGKLIEESINSMLQSLNKQQQLESLLTPLKIEYDTLFGSQIQNTPEEISKLANILKPVAELAGQINNALLELVESPWSTNEDKQDLAPLIDEVNMFLTPYAKYLKTPTGDEKNWLLLEAADKVQYLLSALNKGVKGEKGGIGVARRRAREWNKVRPMFQEYQLRAETPNSELIHIVAAYEKLEEFLKGESLEGSRGAIELVNRLADSYSATYNGRLADLRVEQARMITKKTRGDLDHRKLLNHLIDEQEEKFIELVEGTRSHIAVMDGYLKRLSIALEDDFKVQFYDPAFVRVRDAARSRQVNLGQVERTTILTNNRAFAKVDPQATMEFDLPKRQIAIKEAFDAAKALVEDTGALVNDPTFLAAFQMMGGSKQPTTVKNILPGQSQSTDQQTMGLAPKPQESGAPGSALQSLVPEPSIYKLETGTGFQIRPVMQPDGDSVVYDFDYMYTTNIREPVRADEKHIGRIKRHFVHTAVQTANFEMREISRYQVALKVSRTSQGVPLLQNIPVLGAAFRPAPSAESSIQQNIILGQTNVYPTLFDLMGLRWAQQVVDLDHTSLLEAEHVVRGRQKSMRDFVFEESSARVDDFLGLQKKSPNSYRTDLYHPQTLSSPYHPGGYRHPSGVPDPTGNNFERFDRRPPEMQEPPYDRYRHQPVYPERIGPQAVPESIPMDSLQLKPANWTPSGKMERSSSLPYYEKVTDQNMGPAANPNVLRAVRQSKP